ncbi:hypothetical protein ACFTXM_14410 [Streptomyces sp. NPDC056930]|uniref:hypothetical protein n=1 Tax=Streptomyces sp. NPDC056930 TaxID=3345967 RepID=UPI00364414AC
MGSSVCANSAVGWSAGKVGIEGGAGRALLFLAGLVIALLVDFLLLVYLLARLPRVHPGRRAVVVAGLIGAVGFELLKAAADRLSAGRRGEEHVWCLRCAGCCRAGCCCTARLDGDGGAVQEESRG